ncbi:MAG: protein kinase, partial [Hydrogenophaga sp.]|uniref:protein kinase domain-containing protein n=1 Tax=Hydrogenophaga sp. TaxID=1904254 RepID=UPI0016A6831C
MKLRFDGVISEDGGFADIWLAYDATERKVAVKIVRESSVEISDALAHARALVRAAHKNIVTVFAVTDVEDPGRPGTYAPAIIMEYLSGETLYDAMLSRKFSDMEVLKISIGLIDAVRHIHKSGLVHGDLHEKNIMLVAGEVKVIDLLYRYSLLSVDSAKNAELQRREVDSVSRLIAELATKSSLDPSLIATFMRNEQKSQSLDMLASAVWQLCGAPIVAPSLTSLSLSVILCARHSMTIRSIYAK